MMRTLLALALLMGLFAGMVGCDSGAPAPAPAPAPPPAPSGDSTTTDG